MSAFLLKTKAPQKTDKSKHALQPVIPLIAEVKTDEENDKSKFITVELKARAGAPADSAKYKKNIRTFEEGTPQEWVNLIMDAREIWTQNSINGMTDRASTFRSILKGESLTAFDAAMEEARRDPEADAGAALPAITEAHLNEATNAVAQEVFPHRALEIQKLWMSRGMRKPFKLTTRKTAAAITRLNNALPLFPGGTEADKFKEKEVVQLLEWCLPAAWRAKFDLDGYIPSLDTKKKLIEACEAIERNQKEETKANKGNNNNSKKSSNRNKRAAANSSERQNADASGDFYCKIHGKNPTHTTKECRTLKWKERNGKNSDAAGNSKKGSNNKTTFQLSKEQKKDLFEQFSAEIAKNKSSVKKTSKSKKRKPEGDTESDSDLSVNMLTRVSKPVKRAKIPRKNVKFVKKGDTSDSSDEATVSTVGDASTAEERAFMNAINHKNE